MKIIKYICRISLASWIPRLITSEYELGSSLGFELGLLFYMMLVAPIGSPLGYSINMLLELALCNYFGTWGGSLIGVSFVPLYGLMIGTGERSFFAYRWGFHLDPQLNLQIVEMRCLAHFWMSLLGCDFSLKRSGGGVPVFASWISIKLLAEG